MCSNAARHLSCLCNRNSASSALYSNEHHSDSRRNRSPPQSAATAFPSRPSISFCAWIAFHTRGGLNGMLSIRTPTAS